MNYSKRNAKAYAREYMRGIWAAAATPFVSGDLSIDEAGLRRNIRYWLDDLAIDGLFIAGKQGEFFSMSVPERKRTMEIADVLYGITMEEPGISKLVSVRMA